MLPILQCPNKSRTWCPGSSDFSHAPDIDALPQLVSAVLSHLLAAVALSRGKNPNLFDIEPRPFGNLGKYQVDGDGGSFIADVVIDHDEGRTGFQDPGTFKDDQ